MVSTTQKKRTPVVMRNATRADVPRLALLNRHAYPDLVEANVVWSEEQLAQHLVVFPEGQRVAEATSKAPDEAVVGAISTFIVPVGTDPLAQHTWLEITDHGRFTRHDARGDTLYLADIYVDRASWGMGIGEQLYAGLQRLCISLGCTRIVAGGRLWGYHEHDAKLTPSAYVEQVIARKIPDRVLSSQLKAGFEVRGILTDYLRDPRSRNFATLLEWRAPKSAD